VIFITYPFVKTIHVHVQNIITYSRLNAVNKINLLYRDIYTIRNHGHTRT